MTTSGEVALRDLNKGLMELYNIAQTRSMNEWGVGAATAILSLFPQLTSGSAVESLILGGMSGAALSVPWPLQILSTAWEAS